MKIGICGGTYDPLHNGHEALIRSVLAEGLVDRVIVIPAGQPPHKRQSRISMSRYRYEMAACTFSDEPRIMISDIEIKKDSPSYTLDTAAQLQERFPDDRLVLIYGSDVLVDIRSWHQPLELLARWPLLIADRGGLQAAESRRIAADLSRDTGAQIDFFPAPQIDLSSTTIRNLAADSQPLANYVPACVDAFIRRHALYRWKDELDRIDVSLWHELAVIEHVLWDMLTPKRLLHSLDVLHYALHLSFCHQVSARKVAFAALLHDCAKCLPLREQEGLAREQGDPQLQSGALAHGPAGAMLARRKFGIEDPDILRAIVCHTTGCAEMTSLDQIIFVADKAEPSRTYFDLDEIRVAAERDLDHATYLTLNGVQSFLDRTAIQMHPYTQTAVSNIRKRMKHNADTQTVIDNQTMDD